MKTNKNEYQAWLNRAKEDLLWTEANIKEGIYYGACFTSQQAVEKVLKAYLLFKQEKFEKIHDLVKLLDECVIYDKSFNTFRNKIAKLTFYYIQTRYPDISELDKFTKEEADKAFIVAQKIITFVSDKIK